MQIASYIREDGEIVLPREMGTVLLGDKSVQKKTLEYGDSS